jgi:hypothetical protein
MRLVRTRGVSQKLPAKHPAAGKYACSRSDLFRTLYVHPGFSLLILVASYAAKCIAGHASIWSLRRRAAGNTDRLLTIEVDRQNRAVQVRGAANRAPRIGERKLLERWAVARGINLP